jgi:hypothetical protein
MTEPTPPHDCGEQVALLETKLIKALVALDGALDLAREGWSYATKYFDSKLQYQSRMAVLQEAADDLAEQLDMVRPGRDMDVTQYPFSGGE